MKIINGTNFGYNGIQAQKLYTKCTNLNTLNCDTFGFCSKKQEQANLYGADYSLLDNYRTKRSKTVHQMIEAVKNDEKISKDRDNLIFERIRYATADARAFVEANPQFDYDDICEDLILFVVKETDKELNGEIVRSGANSYSQKRDIYFNNLLNKKNIETDFTEKEQQELDFVDELKAFKKLENDDLRLTFETVSSKIRPRDMAIVYSYFGLDDGNPKTLEEVSKDFNLSTSRISSIINYALRQLRYQKNACFLREFY